MGASCRALFSSYVSQNRGKCESGVKNKENMQGYTCLFTSHLTPLARVNRTLIRLKNLGKKPKTLKHMNKINIGHQNRLQIAVTIKSSASKQQSRCLGRLHY